MVKNMTEEKIGEFKKRLERLEELTGKNLESLWLLIGLDEAKKEFLPVQQRWVATKGSKVDWKETCRRMELANIEREKWFSKWFGEDEK
jgi:hypothetical protein